MNTNQHSYIYTYNEVDRCGYRTEIGREGKTILLKGVYDNGSQLNWSPYEKWENEVNRYHIEFDHNTDLRLIQKSDGKTLSYKDNSIYPEVKGKYCYRVHATNDKSDSSYSNWVCLYGPPVVFIPSGFTPNGDGLNDGFSLVTRFVKHGDLKEIKDFRLSVFNRWGEMIYDSYDVDESWDGRYQDKDCQQGAYIYQIRLTGIDKYILFKSGTITLLR